MIPRYHTSGRDNWRASDRRPRTDAQRIHADGPLATDPRRGTLRLTALIVGLFLAIYAALVAVGAL